ncbi:MAG: ZIP family metal transporter, partial [Acidobacteria bacterium]|nr:ZIP family metal transporter [Acidobacteriota bacterium]
MNADLITLLGFGLMASLANVAGGLLLISGGVRRSLKSVLRYVLAVGAGFMLAVTFFEVIPRTLELWLNTGSEANFTLPLLLILAGYLVTQFFEHAVAPHFHLGEHVEPQIEIAASSAYSVVGGFLIHAFFDGVSIAAASQINAEIGFLVFVAVVIHKFPEGFTIGSILLAAGREPRKVLIATALVGAATLAGVLVYSIVGGGYYLSAAYS